MRDYFPQENVFALPPLPRLSRMFPMRELSQGQQLLLPSPDRAQPQQLRVALPAGHVLFPDTLSACGHSPMLTQSIALPRKAQHPHSL